MLKLTKWKNGVAVSDYGRTHLYTADAYKRGIAILRRYEDKYLDKKFCTITGKIFTVVGVVCVAPDQTPYLVIVYDAFPNDLPSLHRVSNFFSLLEEANEQTT